MSRFKMWSAAVAVVVMGVATGCGSDTPPAGGEAQGPWSYTDASGNTVELDNTPQRIIAHSGAAAALMSFGIRPVGLYADVPVADDPNLEGFDLAGITILGEAWGVIDVELAATLSPDLIVADWWPVEEAYSGVEEGVEEESKRIADLAPMVGSAQGESIVSLIEGYEDLAASLGADLDDPAVAESRQDFEAATGEFEEAVAAKPGLTALAISPTTDLLYVAVPEHAPELLDFQQWGLDVTVPDSPDPGFPYWENLSWETADKYQPDLLLIDDRSYPDNLRTAEEQPTWQRIRAAEAGAVTPWPAFWLHTYSAYAEQLRALTDAINGADPDLGS